MIQRILNQILKKYLNSTLLQDTIDIDKLLHQIHKKQIDNCLKKVTINIESKFYEQTQVNNFQNDREKILIGKNSHIRGFLQVFAYGGEILIGDNCYVGENSYIWSGDFIKIGNNVLISHSVNIVDSNAHELNSLERHKGYLSLLKNGHPKEKGSIITAPIIIKDNVWVNFNSVILKGVTIGEGAVVAAGSVVTTDVPDYAVVGGNPARVIK